jgi:hypothetical protein
MLQTQKWTGLPWIRDSGWGKVEGETKVQGQGPRQKGRMSMLSPGCEVAKVTCVQATGDSAPESLDWRYGSESYQDTDGN